MIFALIVYLSCISLKRGLSLARPPREAPVWLMAALHRGCRTSVVAGYAWRPESIRPAFAMETLANFTIIAPELKLSVPTDALPLQMSVSL
jgi:hypothetical protein